MRDARALQILEMKNNPHRLPLLLQCSAKVQAEKNYLLLDSTHSPWDQWLPKLVICPL